MSNLKKIKTVKNLEVKSIEYPVIYSYIYERESQDIKRLAGKFKNARIKKTSSPVEVKTITAFKLDKDGKITPVFETSKPLQRKAVRARVTNKSIAKNPTKTIQSKKSTTEDKPTED